MRRATIIGAIILLGGAGLFVALRVGDNGAEIDGRDEAVTADGGSPAVGPGAGIGGGAGTAAGVSLPAPGESRVYRVDPARSEVYWRVYRAGPMAALAHNHVISIEGLDGSVTVGNDLTAAAWNLSFRVDALVIDDPELRARYGEDFESVPDEDAKSGTKINMLSDRVLNGAVFPEIRLSGTGLEGPSENARLPVSIEMLGRTIEQTFPVAVALDVDSLTVTGEYRLTHEDLGMEPFSIGGGLMSVGDNIDFTYRIRAVAEGQ